MTLEEMKAAVSAMVRQHGWDRENTKKPQTPKNLAVSISIEAAELLECFQWSENGDKDAVMDELADVLIYASQLANVMNLDLDEVVSRKLERNKHRVWE